MKVFYSLVVLLAITIAIVSCASRENKYERAQRQTAIVRSGGATGTAFFIKRTDCKGEIRVFAWTAAHVIKSRATTIEMTYRRNGERAGSGTFNARVLAISPDTDVALLSVNIDPETVEAVEFAKQTPRVGEPVFHVGNFAGEFDDSVSQGIVSQVGVAVAPTWTVTLDQCDAAAMPGSSGGPLFDASGQVVGVVVGGMLPGVGTWYVPVRKLDAWANENGLAWAVRGTACPLESVLRALSGSVVLPEPKAIFLPL